MLVYHHHADGKSVLPGGKGLEVITYAKLEEILREHPDLKLTKKSIYPSDSTVEIHQKDLAPIEDGEGEIDAHRPNAEQNVAAVSLPLRVQLGNYFLEKYTELTILSWKVGGRGV